MAEEVATEVPQPDAENSGKEETAASKEVLPEKTFTQADLDAVVAKVKAKEHRKREDLKRRLGEPAPREEKAPNEPKRENFESYEDFLDARTDWRADRAATKRINEEAEKREAATRKAEGERVDREWGERLAKAREKFPDVDEAIEALGKEVSAAVGHAIKESDAGPELVVYLHKHPDEFDDLAQMSPTAAIRAIGRLEAKLAASKPEPPKSPSRPINPVGARSTASDELRDDLSDEEWMRRREKHLAEKARAQRA